MATWLFSCSLPLQFSRIPKVKMNRVLLSTAILLTVGQVSGENIQVLSSASSDFSQRLYQQVAVKESNAVYSPYSIHSALSMTSLGARGETATELTKTLGLTLLPGLSAHQAYKDTILQLNSAKDVKLHTANALYLNPDIPIVSQFVSDAETYYLASTSNFDLAAVGGPEKVINDFVNNKTEGLIKDIIPQGTINSETVATLVNTIFFNGTWARTFPEAATRPQEFYKLGGAKSEVSMMRDERYVNIKRNVNGVDVAELPFLGNRFSLYIALPHTIDGITDLESSLTTTGSVDQLFEGLIAERVRLNIPKFKIESSFELTAALKQLGLSKPFDPSSANFQGISTAAQLVISNILHKAVIEVKETGTVAAAVTAIIVGVTSVIEPPSATFIADRPFLFFLRDNLTAQILFQGKFSG